MKRYYVTVIDDCEKCSGRGYVDNDMWLKYFSTKGATIQHDSTAEEIKECYVDWFRDNGVAEHDIPDESAPCPRCLGSGFVSSQAEFSEALNAMMREWLTTERLVRESGMLW